MLGIAELIACCQEFEEQYEPACAVLGEPTTRFLRSPAAQAALRQQAETLMIRLCMFSNALNTLLRRMDPAVADEFSRMQTQA